MTPAKSTSLYLGENVHKKYYDHAGGKTEQVPKIGSRLRKDMNLSSVAESNFKVSLTNLTIALLSPFSISTCCPNAVAKMVSIVNWL